MDYSLVLALAELGAPDDEPTHAAGRACAAAGLDLGTSRCSVAPADDGESRAPGPPRKGLMVRALYVGVIDFLQSWTCGKKRAKCIKTFECNKATEPPPFYARRAATHFDQKFEARPRAGAAAARAAPASTRADGRGADGEPGLLRAPTGEPAAAAGADDVVVDVDAPEPPPLPEGVRSDSDPETPASQPMCGTDPATLCIPKCPRVCAPCRARVVARGRASRGARARRVAAAPPRRRPAESAPEKQRPRLVLFRACFALLA